MTLTPATDTRPPRTLTPGAGDRAPAGARLLLAPSVEVDESAVTGGSPPVPQRAEATAAEDGPPAEEAGHGR